jgi:hypothetical protein
MKRIRQVHEGKLLAAAQQLADAKRNVDRDITQTRDRFNGLDSLREMKAEFEKLLEYKRQTELRLLEQEDAQRKAQRDKEYDEAILEHRKKYRVVRTQSSAISSSAAAADRSQEVPGRLQNVSQVTSLPATTAAPAAQSPLPNLAHLQAAARAADAVRVAATTPPAPLPQPVAPLPSNGTLHGLVQAPPVQSRTEQVINKIPDPPLVQPPPPKPRNPLVDARASATNPIADPSTDNLRRSSGFSAINQASFYSTSFHANASLPPPPNPIPSQVTSSGTAQQARRPLPGGSEATSHDTARTPLSQLLAHSDLTWLTQTKRKADGNDGAKATKKARHSEGTGQQATNASPSVSKGAVDRTPMTDRTVTFNEVYQGGQATHPHHMHEFPANSGVYYILKCEGRGHTVHFRDTLVGPAKHLHSQIHNNMSKDHSLAVRTLGYRVVDATPQLVAENNTAFKRRLDTGYQPINDINKKTPATASRRQSMGAASRSTLVAPGPKAAPAVSHPPSPRVEKTLRPEKGAVQITDPIAGELYRGYWPANKTWYVVMVLAWGDQLVCGLSGNLVKHNLLATKPRRPKVSVPGCYVLSETGEEIVGWADGFGAGGEKVHKRQFPVMFFDKSW